LLAAKAVREFHWLCRSTHVSFSTQGGEAETHLLPETTLNLEARSSSLVSGTVGAVRRDVGDWKVGMRMTCFGCEGNDGKRDMEEGEGEAMRAREVVVSDELQGELVARLRRIMERGSMTTGYGERQGRKNGMKERQSEREEDRRVVKLA
jgi:hypothetical protein